MFLSADIVRLHSGIRGMTPKILRHVLEICEKQAISLSEIFDMSAPILQATFPFLKAAVADQLVNSSSDSASATWDKLQAKGFRIITYNDPIYPQVSEGCRDDMPPILYIYGAPEVLSKQGIGFGGARNVSEKGLRATDQLARYCAKDLGYVVISGHAKGVDVMAHQSALVVQGETVLVLPEGALKFRLNEALRSSWSEDKDRIVIVTQFAPAEPWSVSNAMTRNATAICLSKAFCVIESGDQTGGTWQAGLTALKKNIPLYVLDYDHPPESALGNKKLIQKGGIAVPYTEGKLILPRFDNPGPMITQPSLL